MIETAARPDIDGQPLQIDDLVPGEWAGPELYRTLVNVAGYHGFGLEADHDSGDYFEHWYEPRGDQSAGALVLQVKVGETAVDVALYHVAYDPDDEVRLEELSAETADRIETAGRTATDVAWAIWERCDLPGADDDR